MGDAKEYLEIEDSIAPLEATLDRLSRTSYSTFISDSENEELEENNSRLLSDAIDVLESLHEVTTRFLIDTDLKNTPIPDFFKDISKNAIIASDKSEYYCDDDFEKVSQVLSGGETYTLYTALRDDYIHGIYSNYGLIKKALVANYRLRRAINFKLERYGNIVLKNNLNQLHDYVTALVKTSGFVDKIIAWRPNLEKFSLSLSFEEGKNGDLKISIGSTSWGNEIESHRESFLTSHEELQREITDKVWELGISREQLELCFNVGPIEI
ncbi:MAG: hypothetical protein HEQ14_03360 [Aphanizomenon flos-aquae CP01]|nr:hypothetical protein [Aphanizomenon flos-aquae CP01]